MANLSSLRSRFKLTPFFNLLSDEYLYDALSLVAEELGVLIDMDSDLLLIQTLRSTALNKRERRNGN